MMFLPAAAALGAALTGLEQMEVNTFAELREVERYQLKIAEKHYLAEEYATARDEYEKFLTLYEKSRGAAYAQLMWSHCQVKLRNVNTALREGFQSVIEYWPDSREALLASFLMARSYRDIGEVQKAEVAYEKFIALHEKDPMITLARVELLEMAKKAKSEEKRMKLLQLIAFSSPASEGNKGHVANAKRELAQIQIGNGKMDEALTTLSTMCEGAELSRQVYELSAGIIGHWMGNEKTKAKGLALADTVIAMLMKSVPEDLKEDKARALARDLYCRMAGAYHHSGRTQEIIKTYETMSKLFGSDDEILGKMAEFYKGQKQRDKARAIYAKLENQIAGQLAIAQMWREDGQHDKAIEIYRELMVKDATKASDYLAAIADCYEQTERFALAIQTYRQVDRFPSTHFAMARCHRKLKQYSEAITLYGQAKADNGSAPDAAIQIGYTYEEEGKTEPAIKAFQQTCKAYPTSSQASQAHAHLQDKYKITVTLGGAKED